MPISKSPPVRPGTIRLLASAKNPGRTHLTQESARLFQSLDQHLDRLNEFPRGNEFYGQVKAAQETPLQLTLTVDPLVGQKQLDHSRTVSLISLEGDYVSEPLFINNIIKAPPGKLTLLLEKPGNLVDCPELRPLGLTVTTNGNEGNYARSIRASYDAESIVVYQAFGERIATEALRLGKFGLNFSPLRMTWIKPSFPWLMKRSDWGRNPGQEFILAVRLKRQAFEHLLAAACATNPTIGLYYANEHEYLSESSRLKNRVQWDPDRTVSGHKLRRRAIQLGISPENHPIYHQGIMEIKDITPTAREILAAVQSGDHSPAALPFSATYPTPLDLLKRLEMNQYNSEEDPRV